MSLYKKKILEARKKILKLTLDQEKQINEVYAKAADRLIDEILDLPDTSRTRIHDIDIARLLNEYTRDLYKQLYPNITDNMMESSIIQRQVILNFMDQVATDRVLSKIVKNNINNYSNSVVKTLIAGEYYKDGKTLSKRLWNITKGNSNKIDEFIKMNIAGGANARKLASDLNILINPKNKMITNNFKAGFDSYRISYQAQRLARTSITHAATETQIQNAKKNPFNKGLKWNLSSQHSIRMHGRTDECDDYNGKVFKPNEVPLQHPNCMCYFTEEVISIDSAIERINKWVDGGEDAELDKLFNKAKAKEEKKNIHTSSKPNSDIIKVDKINNNLSKQEHKESNITWNKHLNISEENSKSLNEIHINLNKFMCDNKREKLVLFSDIQCKTIHELEGSSDNEVELNKDTISLLKTSEDNSIIFVHNHPSKTTFSRYDIEKIIKYKSIKCLTLECIDGTKYILDRGNLKSSFIKEFGFMSKYQQIYMNIASKYPELDDEERINDIWGDFLNEVTTEVALKYGMIYKEVIE